jgi:hypothetical protein
MSVLVPSCCHALTLNQTGVLWVNLTLGNLTRVSLPTPTKKCRPIIFKNVGHLEEITKQKESTARKIVPVKNLK